MTSAESVFVSSETLKVCQSHSRLVHRVDHALRSEVFSERNTNKPRVRAVLARPCLLNDAAIILL